MARGERFDDRINSNYNIASLNQQLIQDIRHGQCFESDITVGQTEMGSLLNVRVEKSVVWGVVAHRQQGGDVMPLAGREVLYVTSSCCQQCRGSKPEPENHTRSTNHCKNLPVPQLHSLHFKLSNFYPKPKADKRSCKYFQISKVSEY